MEFRFVYMTAASRDEAKTIGRRLVEERLAACANVIDGMESVYWWQGKLTEDREAVLIAKTRADLLPSLIERVKAVHGYTVPCVVADPNDGNGTCTPVITNSSINRPNGLCFSPEESRLYLADYDARAIRVYSVSSSNTLSAGSIFATLPTPSTSHGNPDGIRCDADGRFYSSSKSGIWIYMPDGRLIGRIITARTVANLCFGGADWRTLYITAQPNVLSIPLRVTGALSLKPLQVASVAGDAVQVSWPWPSTGLQLQWLKLLVWPGLLLWLLPLLRLAAAWWALYRNPAKKWNDNATAITGALPGFMVILTLGAVHSLGTIPATHASVAFIFAFLLPLVTGAASYLLPLWLRPGLQTGWHAHARQTLARFSVIRVMLFISAGLITAGWGATWGWMPAVAGLALFAVQLRVLVMRNST